METKYFFSKNLRLIVEKNDGGEKLFTIKNMDGTPYGNAGSLIASFRDHSSFWERCITKEEFDKRIAQFEFSRSPEAVAQRREVEKKRAEAERAAAKKEFEALAASGSPIPATYENIAIVLRWLNTQNWGTWTLPALSIGYSAQQYDCDGKIATTITLNRPIYVGGEPVSKFVHGAPHGHLLKYQRC